MKFPNFSHERKLAKLGYSRVFGLDEAGRGPLAGPVVAAAVSFKFEISNLKLINDSKKMTAKARQEAYDFLTSHPQIKWGVGIVSEKEIDKINIFQATKLAMRRALENLQADYLLLDGNFKLDLDLSQKPVIKGDQKVISISAASIIAKVNRDKIMEEYDKEYPQYGFGRHKGYGTALHLEMLKKYGACPIHRKTFGPVANLDNN